MVIKRNILPKTGVEYSCVHVRLYISLLSYVNKSKLYFRYNLKNNTDSCGKAWYICVLFPMGINIIIDVNKTRITITNLFNNCILFCGKNGNQGSLISLLKM